LGKAAMSTTEDDLDRAYHAIDSDVLALLEEGR